MKLIETLTRQQITDMVSGGVVGLFVTTIQPSDPFHNKANAMCISYYLNRSADKTISPTFNRFMELSDNNQNPAESVGTIIRAKFIEKWLRVYEVILNNQYDPLNNYEYTENRKTDDETTNNGGSTSTDNGKTATKETTTSARTIHDGIYGFNSKVAVNDSESTESVTDTVVALPDENTTFHNRTESNNNTRVVDRTEDISKSGRDVAGSENLIKELDFRNTQNFFDIVFADIDSVATLQIYV